MNANPRGFFSLTGLFVGAVLAMVFIGLFKTYVWHAHINDAVTESAAIRHDADAQKNSPIAVSYSVSGTDLKTSNGFTLTLPRGWTLGIDNAIPDHPYTKLYTADKKGVAVLNCPSAPKAEFFEETQHSTEKRTFTSSDETFTAKYDDFIGTGDYAGDVVEADVYLAPVGLTYETYGMYGEDATNNKTCLISTYTEVTPEVLAGFRLMYQSAHR